MATEKEREEKESLSKALRTTNNTGKKLDEVGERQKRRKLAQLQTYTANTLEPCMESYGLTPTAVTAITDMGTPISINLSDAPGPSPLSAAASSQDNTASTLYLLDRYGVSDEFYHELAQTTQELPRLHHVKALRKDLNSQVDTIRLPHPYDGCYIHIRAAVSKALSSLLQKTTGPHHNRVTLKLSGDGTSFSSSTSFIFLTFSFPELAKDVLAASGNHTYASAKGHETYEFLRDCFAPVWDEVAELIANPVIRVNEGDYTLKVVCGSDYKYLLLMMGLNNATSTYSCIWCTVSKEERWDMSATDVVYNCPPPHGKARSLATLIQNSQFSQPKKHLGSKNLPILKMEPTSIILDELHLLLRIGDVLLRNVILQADSLDHRVYMAEGRQTNNHLKTLETLVRRCGVSFVIRPVVNENNKPVAGLFTWTALNRKQKLKVLKELPDYLDAILSDDDANQIGKLWQDFVEIYELVCSEFPSADEIHSRAQQWVRHFLALTRLEGYQRKNVTPYMHNLVYHVPAQIRMYGNLIRFSGQGVEKNNDAAKHCYFSSNKHDPCGEVIRTERRQDALQDCRREKRPYTKTDEHYWTLGIRQQRAKRPRSPDTD